MGWRCSPTSKSSLMRAGCSPAPASRPGCSACRYAPMPGRSRSITPGWACCWKAAVIAASNSRNRTSSASLTRFSPSSPRDHPDGNLGRLIVGGTFNNTPTSPLAQQMRDAGFVDPFAGQPLDRGHIGTHRPAARVDYLWLRPPLLATNCAGTMDTQRLRPSHGGDRGASSAVRPLPVACSSPASTRRSALRAAAWAAVCLLRPLPAAPQPAHQAAPRQ
jgi:hypothetical protein